MFDKGKLTASTEKFKKYVEPQLYDSGLFDPNNSYVIICEGDSDDLRSKMDLYAGIDMCTVDKNHQTVQGVASRIQEGPCWRTFTIRAITDHGNLDTEFRKRSQAIANGDMYPTWTIQAYITRSDEDPDKLICTVGVIRTTELFTYIMDQLSDEHFATWGDFRQAITSRYDINELDIRSAGDGGAIFLVCSWDKLIEHNINLTILQGEFDT